MAKDAHQESVATGDYILSLLGQKDNSLEANTTPGYCYCINLDSNAV